MNRFLSQEQSTMQKQPKRFNIHRSNHQRSIGICMVILFACMILPITSKPSSQYLTQYQGMERRIRQAKSQLESTQKNDISSMTQDQWKKVQDIYDTVRNIENEFQQLKAKQKQDPQVWFYQRWILDSIKGRIDKLITQCYGILDPLMKEKPTFAQPIINPPPISNLSIIQQPTIINTTVIPLQINKQNVSKEQSKVKQIQQPLQDQYQTIEDPQQIPLSTSSSQQKPTPNGVSPSKDTSQAQLINNLTQSFINSISHNQTLSVPNKTQSSLMQNLFLASVANTSFDSISKPINSTPIVTEQKPHQNTSILTSLFHSFSPSPYLGIFTNPHSKQEQKTQPNVDKTEIKSNQTDSSALASSQSSQKTDNLVNDSQKVKPQKEKQQQITSSEEKQSIKSQNEEKQSIELSGGISPGSKPSSQIISALLDTKGVNSSAVVHTHQLSNPSVESTPSTLTANYNNLANNTNYQNLVKTSTAINNLKKQQHQKLLFVLTMLSFIAVFV